MKAFALILKSLLVSLVLSVSAFASTPVNINTANAQELADALNGIGPAKAEAIVAYREAHGAFESADQLVSVKGIGLATLEKNRALIVVTSDEAPVEASVSNDVADATAQ